MSRQPSQTDSSSKQTASVSPALAAKSGQDPVLEGGLYVVATPIGNRADMSARAVEILRRAAVIACEDTRVTGTLMAHLGVATSLTPYHEHNAARQRPALLTRLARGEAVALVSDAGTPLISDPGYKLVEGAVADGHRVIPIPGPSALLAALVASGLPSDRFLFAGFPPARDGPRARWLDDLAAVPATLIVYDSARRLPDLLAAMAAHLGDSRPAAVCRELTKRYEEVRRDSLAGLATRYAEEGPPKGEVVVVVGPPDPASAGAGAAFSEEDLDARLRAALVEGLGTKAAAASVAAETGLPKRDLYQRALRLDRGGEGGP